MRAEYQYHPHLKRCTCSSLAILQNPVLEKWFNQQITQKQTEQQKVILNQQQQQKLLEQIGVFKNVGTFTN
jgi:hypothetical protein